MKTFYKVIISLLLGISLICIGISMGGLSQVSSLSYISHIDFRWKAKQIEDQEVTLQDIRQLKIDVSSAQINFHENDSLNTIQIKATQILEGFKITYHDDQVKIKQPKYWWYRNGSNPVYIDIYVPKGYTFDTVKIDAGIGQSKLSGLNAKEIKVDVGAGQMTLHQISCDILDIDTGMGETTGDHITCRREADIDVGMGSSYLSLQGKEIDYDYNVDVGIGNVIIGQQEFSGIADHKSYQGELCKPLIKVSCGMGSVEIKMEE